MQKSLTAEKQPAVLSFLPDDETSHCILEKDWSQTPLGPTQNWPQPLRTSLRNLLYTQLPTLLFWGNDLCFFYNDAYRSCFGKRDPHNDLGRPVREVWMKDWPVLPSQIETVMAKGKASLHENQAISVSHYGDGQRVHFTYSISPVYDDASPIPTGVLVTCTEPTINAGAVKTTNDDETGLSDAVKKAEDNEKRFTNLLVQSPMAIAILKGKDMVVETANPTIIAVWGKGSDVVGKPLLAIMPEIAEQGFPQLLQEVYATGKPFYGYEMKVQLQRNGIWEDVYFNFIYQPYRETDGIISGIMILATEVTEQVRAKKNAAQSESRFSNLVKEARVGVIVLTGREMKVEVANAAFGQIAGHSPEELMGNPLFDVMPEAERLYRPVLDQVRMSGKPLSLYGKAYVVYKANKKIKGFLNLVCQPYKNAGGSPLGVMVLCHNVTEQTLALKRAKDSEEKLRMALQGGDLGTFDFYPKTGKMSWSAKTKELFGLPPNTVESFELFSKALHPDDREQEIAIADNAMRGENSGLYENEYRTVGITDGKLRWVRSKGKAVFGEDGKPVRFSGVTQDVTQRKQAEERLRIAQKQLELTIENVPAAIYLFDDKANILYLNKRGRQHIQHLLKDNYQPNESLETLLKKFAGKVRYTDVDGEPMQAERYPMMVALKTGKEATLMMKRIYNDTGREEWFLNKVTPLLDDKGKVEFILSTATDYTEQKEAEQKLRESESRFRTLAETLPQMIWVSDSNRSNEYFSSQWKAYSGMDDPFEAWENMTHPDDKEASTQAYREAFAQGLPFRSEVRLKNKNGEYRWHSSVAEPVKDSAGNTVKWVGTLTDIHDQKLAAEKLEKIVAERTRELQRSNEDLQQFAHVASHDLKEPVRKVRTFSGRLREELGNNLTEQSQTYLTKIEGAADRMYSMIDGVLAYSSLNAAEQTRERVDLNDVLHDVAIDLEVLMQEKAATLDYAGLPTLEGIPVLLHQLFYNLVNNSLKFAKAGIPPQIFIRSETKENHVTIVVQDNGIGFDQKQAKHIFQTFSRLNSKDKYEGTGLGLALCKKIVERHGGVITAEGKEGEGARFEITLPIKGKSE